MAENYALVNLLRAAWENGAGWGDKGSRPDEDDAAFAVWLEEHAEEVASMLAQFAAQVVAAERTRLARNVRGLQGPMAWRRFQMKHSLANNSASVGGAAFVRAISDEIASGWEA